MEKNMENENNEILTPEAVNETMTAPLLKKLNDSVPRSEYDRVVQEYTTLANGFNSFAANGSTEPELEPPSEEDVNNSRQAFFDNIGKSAIDYIDSFLNFRDTAISAGLDDPCLPTVAEGLDPDIAYEKSEKYQETADALRSIIEYCRTVPKREQNKLFLSELKRCGI